MYYLSATLHVLGVHATQQLHEGLLERRKTLGRADRGSVTIEQVVWAVAVIAIVGIVVVAITNYVTTKSAQIR
ncbi:hypothetical protein [Lapillicoccus sp.]|uniref:hypothetical protein n=1 Tax=Lapillicoccus sp. TaxID=1909287 RepID=UPI0026002C9D|nr:hypothetical protein [Lapillicoccus sp.]